MIRCDIGVFSAIGTYSKTLRFRSRGSLVTATVILQALVVGLGWWGTLSVAKTGLASRVRERVVDEMSRAVTQFSTVLDRTSPGPLIAGSDSCAATQQLVETFKLPNGSALAVIDREGHVACHSNGRANAVALSSGTSAGTVLTLLPGKEVIPLGALNPGTVVTAEADLFGTPSIVALLASPQTGAKIVAYQPRSAVEAAESRFTRGVLLWCAGAGVLLLGITVLGSAMLVRRYDTILLRLIAKLEEEVERRTRRGLAIRNALIFGLAKLADYRDTDTGSHLERICRYCELLAQELVRARPEIDRAWIERLKLASSMHDIGKVGIPDSILLKPGALTKEERRQMETHVAIGADTLAAIRKHVGDDDLINMSIQVAMCHHEKYDGTGYPNKLSGEQIPLCARIAALADVYDALTSKRVYKDAMTHEKASQVLEESRGTQFDPMVVDAFLRVKSKFDAVRRELQPAEAVPSILAISVQQAEIARRAAA